MCDHRHQRPNFSPRQTDDQRHLQIHRQLHRLWYSQPDRHQAHLAFDWFLGRNDLGIPIYNSSTGGCYDGLSASGVNENQGAESTLAFLLSLAEMQRLEVSVAAFKHSPGKSSPVHAQASSTMIGGYAN